MRSCDVARARLVGRNHDLVTSGSGSDGEHFDDAQQLADALGLPVHEPTWPTHTGPRRYVLKPAHLLPAQAHYAIFAEVRRGDPPLLVQGA